MTLPELDAHENGNHEAKADKQSDDFGVVPRVLGSSPLQGQQQTHNSRDEDGCSGQIELTNSLHECHVLSFRRVAIDVHEESDNAHGQGPDGEIDVKTPSPANIFRECSAEKRSCDRSDPPHAADQTGHHGALAKWHLETC